MRLGISVSIPLESTFSSTLQRYSISKSYSSLEYSNTDGAAEMTKSQALYPINSIFISRESHVSVQF